ncbi:GtrA family protein [Rhodanobacter sp. L36]|uniref:GtrA family protein n=1 Tax=Rhodanobacter sp. L36 TaxID=1747221 RepID=UPI0020B11AC2|nr:GtrA family protein [Rhodanobacter sp. L36]
MSSWVRQIVLFGIVGLLQVAIDTGVLVGLTALGVAVAGANICGRISGACVGFLLNGTTTFSSPAPRRLHRGALARFLIMWIPLTIISTLLMSVLRAQVSLQSVWAIKPVVEIGLAMISFLVSKFWVYK